MPIDQDPQVMNETKLHTPVKIVPLKKNVIQPTIVKVNDGNRSGNSNELEDDPRIVKHTSEMSLDENHGGLGMGSSGIVLNVKRKKRDKRKSKGQNY